MRSSRPSLLLCLAAALSACGGGGGGSSTGGGATGGTPAPSPTPTATPTPTPTTAACSLSSREDWALAFTTAAQAQTPLVGATPRELLYCHQEFSYSVAAEAGTFRGEPGAVTAVPEDGTVRWRLSTL